MWFSIFAITKFNYKCWKNNFWMSKCMLFDRTHQFNIHIKKEDTTYRLAIYVEVWVACTIYKVEFGTRCKFIFMLQIICNMQICWFNCRQGIKSINIMFNWLSHWPIGEEMNVSTKGFKNVWIVMCPWNIDATYLKNCKSSGAFAKDYFYHKTRSYYVVF
jgi:hypothetical protein